MIVQCALYSGVAAGCRSDAAPGSNPVMVLPVVLTICGNVPSPARRFSASSTLHPNVAVGAAREAEGLRRSSCEG